MALTGQEKTRPFGQSNYGVYCCAVGSFLRAQTAQAFEKTGENKEKMPEGRENKGFRTAPGCAFTLRGY